MAASWKMFAPLLLGFLLTFFGLRGVHSAIRCEELPIQVCAFSVSSSGNRCVLEKSLMADGCIQFECQSSVVMAETMIEWIESEECINACGLERMSVGMSTDSLLEAEFAKKLCSSKCHNNCPNIVDLYLNLAAGEGIYLTKLCDAQRSNSRRMVEEVLNSAKSSITSESFVAVAPEVGHLGKLIGVSAPDVSPAIAPVAF
eukprot:Gb_21780 [translate_table: standard]